MVSRIWRTTALSLLFHSLMVSIDESSRSLDALMILLRVSPAVAPCIRTLHVAGSSTFDFRRARENQSLLQPEQLASVLQDLPNLDELWVMFCRVPDCTELPVPSLSLKRLLLRGLYSPGPTVHGGIAALLRLFTSLGTLTLQYNGSVPTTFVPWPSRHLLEVHNLAVHVRAHDDPRTQLVLLNTFSILSSVTTLVVIPTTLEDVHSAIDFLPRSTKLRAVVLDFTMLWEAAFRWDLGHVRGTSSISVLL